MKKHILSLPGADVPLESLLSALHIDADDDAAADVAALHAQAMAVARPVALYMPLAPTLYEGGMRIGDTDFDNPFVYKMLSECALVVPYTASCGQEIEQWSGGFTDIFEQFVADTLKQLCLVCIRTQLFETVTAQCFDRTKNISSINPGSLKEWPITGQIPLFDLLGGRQTEIGVVLSDSLLMFPTKSVSGILFQSDTAYENCQFCPRENCPGRRAPYAGD